MPGAYDGTKYWLHCGRGAGTLAMEELCETWVSNPSVAVGFCDY